MLVACHQLVSFRLRVECFSRGRRYPQPAFYDRTPQRVFCSLSLLPEQKEPLKMLALARTLLALVMRLLALVIGLLASVTHPETHLTIPLEKEHSLLLFLSLRDA